ncbi:MAG: LL-diaminopimelate aminotransferase [Candidatus Omnitrophica bacterium ADurb.Bin292]|jgi:LL-diaminopimelate aminotransferase|nr:MAG: LL-diaminopimelate aminotransferase [Candidatus Omnitrophica bacterium ADurb.Bin292]HOG23777.1 LL-diaminopimelate aminotransferase [Candidatus Omnitrophota bacterium]HPW77175.1 LL-diaminopimelate aminotransferase [Candidatus Omnitrophota bacterium]HQB11972.1 LL-diaminopimelate aminotransferase [Candidatus Omnitrophota bacterium]
MFKTPLAIEPTSRLQKLPPYLFAEIDRKKRELIAKGKDVIDLGVGDPDIPTPDFIVHAMQKAVENPRNHRYALDLGMPEFRLAIRDWFERRFHVKLDPDKEILPLIGSKEGIGHLPLAVINPGQVCLIPDPGYPVYRSGTLFAEGIPYTMPLLEKNHFLPELHLIPGDVLKNARLMFLNYPNNPTSQVADKSFFAEVVEFAHKHKILIAHDAAYSEMTYDGYKAPSILEVPGAKEVAIEFFSLSKTYNMTGWRVGFAVGHPQAIALLGKVKSNLDSGIFQAIQLAAITALKDGDSALEENLKIYQGRRDLLIQGMNNLGFKTALPRATFYCWIPVPPGYTSSELSLKFLEEMNIVVTPGNGFGPNGEGYFRISLTVAESRLLEALTRVKKSYSRS